MPAIIFNVLAVRRDALATHKAALQAAITAHFKAVQRLRHSPQDTSYRLARCMGVDGSEVLAGLRGIALPDAHRNAELLQHDQLGSVVQRLIELLQELGELSEQATSKQLFTAELLPPVR